MRKLSEPPPPKGWTAKAWDKHLNRKEKDGFYGTLYPNAGEKLSEFDDTIFSGDPTRMMPRLRQIHKLGYKLQGKTNFQGLPISIENRKGSVRTGKDDGGHEWRTKMAALFDELEKIGKLTFPSEEHESLKKRLSSGKPIYTTRISRERGRYKPGQELETPWGHKVRVTDVSHGKGVGQHKFKEELTAGQKQQIGQHRFDLVKMELSR